MELNGLSIEQAPPISVPLRFFLSAPLFGILAGVLIFFSDVATLMSRYSLDSIVITHVITIGFLGFIMLGAISQMLPVLAGARIPKVKQVASISHALLLVGSLCMFLGIYTSNTIYNIIAFAGLGLGFLLILSAISLSLKTVTNFNATVKGISASIFFAFSTVLMGLYLLLSYITQDISSVHTIVSNVHSVWAIFGFAGILIIGVAFQVLPMFYVAPHFKDFCLKRIVPILSIGLFVWLFLNIFYEEYAFLAKFWVALFFWAFATTVAIKLLKRRRPISDVTVWYWGSASIFFTFGLFLWVADEYLEHEYITLVAVLIGGGYILSVMSGMMYKIIPFLVWFHLNAKGYMSIPTMNEMINKKLAKIQFILFILALLGFIVSYFVPELLQIAAFSFIVSMIILEYNIIAPVLLYRKTLLLKPDFDMSMMQASN
ncbi:MAG: hypothetical protein ACI9TV_003020 [Sulfurimonas sp.]|uniref:hypothetical protein n=1 Tax=Sulfurimonas sp. TaxID=2022749 RepID=UPI0039E231EF